MIIIKIQGGLGNQLFQYAFGKLLEVTYKKEVAYDLSFFEKTHSYTKRSYLLDHFNTHLRVAIDQEIEKVKYPYGLISKALYWTKKALNKYIFKHYHIAYEEGFVERFGTIDSAYVEGYFQSSKYVLPVVETLRKEITLKDKGSDAYENFLTQIESSNSVFVHIRRGDYTQSGQNSMTLDTIYYEEAAKHIASYISNPTYFIFSDDIAWAKENVGSLFKSAVYVSQSRLSLPEEVEEMVLMTHARNAIIANSTFSWWGAMLAKKEGGTVICPKDWKNPYLLNNEDLCGGEWVKL